MMSPKGAAKDGLPIVDAPANELTREIEARLVNLEQAVEQLKDHVAAAASHSGLEWEYTALREEILKRMEVRSKTIEITLIGTGAILVAGMQTANLSLILLLYPILILLLAASYRHNELGLKCVSEYMAEFEQRNHHLGLRWERHITGENSSKKYYSFKALSATDSAVFLLIQLLAIGLALAKYGYKFGTIEWVLLASSVAAFLVTLDLARSSRPLCLRIARSRRRTRSALLRQARRYLARRRALYAWGALGCIGVFVMVQMVNAVQHAAGKVQEAVYVCEPAGHTGHKGTGVACTPSQTIRLSVLPQAELVVAGQAGSSSPTTSSSAAVFLSRKEGDGSYNVLGQYAISSPAALSHKTINLHLSSVFGALSVIPRSGSVYNIEIDRGGASLGMAEFRLGP